MKLTSNIKTTSKRQNQAKSTSQIYKTKTTKQNILIPDQNTPNQTFQSNKIKAQKSNSHAEFAIKNLLVNQSKLGSNQSQPSLSLL